MFFSENADRFLKILSVDFHSIFIVVSNKIIWIHIRGQNLENRGIILLYYRT